MADLTDLVDERRQSPATLPSALACLAIFAVGFVASNLALRAESPPYLDTHNMRVKLEHLAAHGDRYDTIFLGSSHVYRQIVPEVFDAAAAEAGVPTHSFNFGIAGMRGLELEFVLDRILARRLPNLRWVVIEPGDPAERAEAANRENERFVAWHDWTHTWRALDLLLGGERPGYDWSSWAHEHLPALARRELNLGRGSERIRNRPRPESDAIGPAGDGFVALDWRDSDSIRERRREFLNDVDGFRARTLEYAALVGSGVRDLEPFERRFLARLVARVEQAGARAIFLIPPVQNANDEFLLRAADEGVVPVVLHYADPALHPDFYDPELRFDRGHLNLKGAKLFSARLARDFADYVNGDRPRRVARRP